eukprot:scaffold18249_cov50-Prasinocladus_malaysianus.AAC.1
MAEWGGDPTGRSGSSRLGAHGQGYLRSQIPGMHPPYDYPGGVGPPSLYSDGSAWQHEYPPDYPYGPDGGWADRRRPPVPGSERAPSHPLAAYPYAASEHYGAPPGPGGMLHQGGGYYGQNHWGAPGPVPPRPNDSRLPPSSGHSKRLGVPSMHDGVGSPPSRAASLGYAGTPPSMIQPPRHSGLSNPSGGYPPGASARGMPPSHPSAAYPYSTARMEKHDEFESGESDGDRSLGATSDGYLSAEDGRGSRPHGLNGSQGDGFRDGVDDGSEQGRARKPKSKEANRRAVRQYRMRKKQAVKDLSIEHTALTERVAFLSEL